MSFDNYDTWKLDNGETDQFEDSFTVDVVGTDRNIDEFHKKFNELMLELAKECDVCIK